MWPTIGEKSITNIWYLMLPRSWATENNQMLVEGNSPNYLAKALPNSGWAFFLPIDVHVDYWSNVGQKVGQFFTQHFYSVHVHTKFQPDRTYGSFIIDVKFAPLRCCHVTPNNTSWWRKCLGHNYAIWTSFGPSLVKIDCLEVSKVGSTVSV